MNITICNFKGGVGKSLIAHQLITGFGYQGIEIDPYGSLTARLPKQVNMVNIDAKTLDTYTNTIFDFGGFNDIKIEHAIAQSDLVIVPFNATMETLQSTIDTLNTIKEYNKPILFIGNMVQKPEDIQEVNVIIQDILGCECEIFLIPMSAAFQTAINQNVSVLELAQGGGLKSFAYRKAAGIMHELKKSIDFYAQDI